MPNAQDFTCPFCKIGVSPDGTCQKCGRVWKWNEYGGFWESQRRAVILKKMPEVGDRLDDCIEPIKEAS